MNILNKLLALVSFSLIFPAAAWQTFHGTPDLTGTASQEPAAKPGILWRLGTGAPVSFPCLMDSQRIYAFNDQGSVIVCDYEGRAIWRWTLPRQASMRKGEQRKFGNTGVLVGNGVAMATEDGDIFLLKKNTGEIIWKNKLKINVIAPLNTVLGGGEELILVTDQTTGATHALRTETGEQVWRSSENGRSDCPPAADKGYVVLGSCLAELHAVSSENGKTLNDIKLGQDCQIAAGAALSGNRAIIGDRGSAVTAVDLKTGETTWRTPLDAGAVFTTPAVTPSHTAVGTEDRLLIVLNSQTGALIWKKKLDLAPSSPAIAGNQLVTTDDGTIYFFELDTGDLIWKRQISDSISPVSMNKGIIVFGTDEGEIIAIKGKKVD